ncbi:Oxysterol-binding protein [Cantharellus anzutake]|uniref:Oxysterol-binding protein n=1 Tax=Cantharellus anzutake TaxID=1750568 RepID=UPI0019050861|nr:Oxysterol-binding protein [Cantharellus anzutake]KAF8338148.1 Oxysterol-binding protein [Cantharellus anzutake]
MSNLRDENEGSIIMSLISQLRIGMDLSKVAFPTFVLEPRSMLQRITDFMSHPDLIFGAENEADPEERFLRVLRYYMSGWHRKPRGVKKPYNPTLGEFFRCRFEYKDGSKGFYIAEQVSHHPPISAYFYVSPANRLVIAGELRPKSRFLGNSVSTIMEGENRVVFLGKPEDGEYVISMPNMYARGILFGKMVLELGDTSVARCKNTGLSCEINFKTKGMFSGTYNAVSGKVKKDDGFEVGEVSGTWSQSMQFKSARGNTRTLFDVVAEGKDLPRMIISSEEEQEPNESQRQWSKLTKAIGEKNMDAATGAKVSVEDAQRELARRREEKNEKFVPRFFELRDGLWKVKFELPPTPEEQIAAVEAWIWPKEVEPSA